MTGDTPLKSSEAAARSAASAVEIDASAERVWRALTDGAELERWFPLRARVEPGVGGRIWMSWGNEFTGALEILRWEPPARLQTSWNLVEGDAATVTDYALESLAGNRTLLRVVTSGFPEGAGWDAWLEDTRRGWHFELQSLKHYLEQHEGRDRRTIYLRRRVALPVEESWRRVAGEDGILPEPAQQRHVIDNAPPLQFAAILDDPDGALLRVSVEPTGSPGGIGERERERDVTIWLSDWSGAERKRAELETAWKNSLRQLFPEGRDA
jgi:uncharacterized protein YndB with AHSA1/START domain